jgi:hypothetical protein
MAVWSLAKQLFFETKICDFGKSKSKKTDLFLNKEYHLEKKE